MSGNLTQGVRPADDEILFYEKTVLILLLKTTYLSVPGLQLV
jgi:hypothetical protein